MLTGTSDPGAVQEKQAMQVRRRLVFNASAGVVGLSTASVLLAPKVAALLTGNLAVLGVGAVANLALVFGSLMFLREAQRARATLRPEPPR
jgi:ABC-type transporter lipoprotein component MlaA